MTRKKTNLSFMGISAVIFTAMLFTAPSDRPKKGGEDDAALAALTGMGAGPRASQTQKKSRSLFDSSFWQAGSSNEPLPDDAGAKGNEEEPEILEKVSEGNPTNPQTNLPYTDDQMEQFEKLREKFPGNSLIPTRTTPEMQKKQEEERRSIFAVQSRITSRQATAEEITTFYDFQEKGMRDRVQLLDYVMEKMSDEMDEEMKKKYGEVLEANRRQIQNLEEQKKKAIQEAGR